MNRHIMKPCLVALFLTLLVLPEAGYGQSKQKQVTIMRTEKNKYYKGYLVDVNDSTLFLTEEKFGRDTILIFYRSIYSINPGRKPGKGILIGAVTGSLIGALMGGAMDTMNDVVFTVSTYGQYQGGQTNFHGTGILIGFLAGGLTGLVIDGNAYRKPILTEYSKEKLTVVKPLLKEYLPKSKR